MKTTTNSNIIDFKNTGFINILNYAENKYPVRENFKFFTSDTERFNIKDDFYYFLNSHRFRSDEFSKESTRQNFLFAGCSQTLGVGLPMELVWSHKVNSMFNKTYFNNLSGVSLSIDTIIINVIKYIELFGSPEAIVILFPDHFRVTRFVDDKIVSKWLDPRKYSQTQDGRDEINFAFFKYATEIKHLEVLCDSLNIPLVYSSWQEETSILLAKLVEDGYLKYGFDIYKHDDVELELYDKKNTKYPHYWKVARDEVHFGEMRNIYFAESFINQLKGLGINA